jgi:hypothetical protein
MCDPFFVQSREQLIDVAEWYRTVTQTSSTTKMT